MQPSKHTHTNTHTTGLLLQHRELGGHPGIVVLHAARVLQDARDHACIVCVEKREHIIYVVVGNPIRLDSE